MFGSGSVRFRIIKKKKKKSAMILHLSCAQQKKKKRNKRQEYKISTREEGVQKVPPPQKQTVLSWRQTCMVTIAIGQEY